VLGGALRVRVRHGGVVFTAPVPDAAEADVPCGGLLVRVARRRGRVDWSVANASGAALALDSVQLVGAVAGSGEVAVLCHGYQSWSPSGVRRLGVDVDASRHPRSPAWARFAHHADPGVAAHGELRSEQVAVLDGCNADASAARLLVGFLGGATHAGTVRVTRTDAESGAEQVEIAAEAWLGGAVLPAGADRLLHPVVTATGDDPGALLGAWSAAVGALEGARVAAPYQVGWCSWYHYFHDVTETAVRDNLARASDWPFDVFQVDDGFQAHIGDWLNTAASFPSGLAPIADAITAEGCRPGLWLAPFLAHPDAPIAARREWFATDARGEPVAGMYHENWGGVQWQLDTTHPDVLEHLAQTARALRELGFSYLKLDFTFSPGAPGVYADATKTPAERVRAGYEAVRRGAGDDAFILACGCPIGAVVGVVDAMRIGPDVAPSWELPPGAAALPGLEASAPATRHAFDATLMRSFMHRRLWLNDPDCLMLRTQETALSPTEARAWALAVGISGGLALVSDDLALLDARSAALLDEVVALGRDSDAAARNGAPAHCDDMLSPTGPTTLRAAGKRLVVRPRAATAVGGAGATPTDPHVTLEEY
jgi:alpha-galactosidase